MTQDASGPRPVAYNATRQLIDSGRKHVATMAETLVNLIEGIPTDRVTMLPTSLVIRDSV